ncbi:MAG: hypothetical protein JW770_06725 [Actinobacteria bacterium]|nr:hypothetical protein [Actinomycetota bacterium]
MNVKAKLIRKDNSYYLPQGRPDQPLRLVQLEDEEITLVKKLYGLPDDVNPAFVISLGGKPYIVHQGLIDLAHKRKLKKIISKEVKVVRCRDRGCVRQVHKGYRDNTGNAYRTAGEVPQDLWNQKKVYKNMVELAPGDSEYTFVYGTTVVMKDGSKYYAEADACPHNTTSTVRGALSRMAQTRSVNIALGRTLNVGLTSAEELPAMDVDTETGEVKEKDDDSQRKTLLKEINSLREKLLMEKAQLGRLAREQYGKDDPMALSIEELCDLKGYLKVRIENLKDENNQEKKEAEQIETEFLKSQGSDNNGEEIWMV